MATIHFPQFTGKVGRITKVRKQEAGQTPAGKAYDAFYSVRIVTQDGLGFVDLTKAAAKIENPDDLFVGALVALEEIVLTEGSRAGEPQQYFTLL